MAVCTMGSFWSLLKGGREKSRGRGVPGKVGVFAKLSSVKRIGHRSSLAHVSSREGGGWLPSFDDGSFNK